MTNNTVNDLASQLKVAEEENQLLLLQLHKVQEEMERYYLRNQTLQQSNGGERCADWVDEDTPLILAENMQLAALNEAQRKVFQFEKQNSMNVILGDMLIAAADQPSKMLTLPGKLISIWRNWSKKSANALLGGAKFDKAIACFKEGGFDALEKLLSPLAISPGLCAQAYTAVARHLSQYNPSGAAKAAERAFELDPKPYRLKWLAFRVHEMGDAVQAEALIALLPPSIEFSQSESRQVSQLRFESKTTRLREAMKKSNYEARRLANEEKIRKLTHDREQQAKFVLELNQKNELLKRENTQLQQKIDGAIAELEKVRILTDENINSKKNLEEDNRLIVSQLHRVQEELERYFNINRALEQEIGQKAATAVELESEKMALVEYQNELIKLAEDRQLLIDALTREKIELLDVSEELSRNVRTVEENQAQSLEKIQDQDQQIAALNSAYANLESEKMALVATGEDQLKEIKDKLSAIDALMKEKTELSQAIVRLSSEKVLIEQSCAQSEQKILAQADEISLLRGAQSKLDSEKLALTAKLEEQSKLSLERQKQINELQLQLQAKQSNETELTARQHMLQEEMARAEAQLDLIKELVLREPSL